MAIALGCGGTTAPTPAPEGDGAMWISVQSPLTGRCYEVVVWGHEGTFRGKGWAGMSEVPCEEVGRVRTAPSSDDNERK